MSSAPDERFFRQVCCSASVGLIALDDQLTVRFCNEAAGRICGAGAESMIGGRVPDHVPPERRDEVAALLDGALQRRCPGEIEFRCERPGGRSLYLALAISPIVGEDDRQMGVLVAVRDMTRGMELVRDVAEAQRMSALGTMAGAVAHHFNNVIGGIITAIDFAGSSNDPVALRRALRTTASALTRANDLTLQLLAFAEGDHSQSSREDARTTVERFVAETRPQLERAGVRLEADLQPVDARIPARQLAHVLEILVTNAREAQGNGGTVRIALAPGEDQQAVLTVQDQGQGVRPEHLAHVFEPFFTTKSIGDPDKPDHRGLGLAVAHGIVMGLGGTIAISCGQDGGTRCTVRLPGRSDNGPTDLQ